MEGFFEHPCEATSEIVAIFFPSPYVQTHRNKSKTPETHSETNSEQTPETRTKKQCRRPITSCSRQSHKRLTEQPQEVPSQVGVSHAPAVHVATPDGVYPVAQANVHVEPELVSSHAELSPSMLVISGSAAQSADNNTPQKTMQKNWSSSRHTRNPPFTYASTAVYPISIPDKNIQSTTCLPMRLNKRVMEKFSRHF